MKLSSYGKREWLTILVVGFTLTLTLSLTGLWIGGGLTALTTGVLLSFFRDPSRTIPIDRNIAVSPADGHVSSIHRVEHFEPFNGPATCIRIFLSVMDVHINRSPCHGLIGSIVHQNGRHLNVLNPESAEVNESNLIVFLHPTHQYPIAAVRQVAGLIARTIVCGVTEGQVLQRGQRMGMIKFGSTTELYLPDTLRPRVAVQQGQKVRGGSTILAKTSTNPVQTPVTPTTPNPKATHGSATTLTVGT